MDTSIYGVDENGNAAVRVTKNAATTTDPTSIYGVDENGNAAMRVMGIGGGEGGTSNYNELSNKPQINGVTLSGNKTASDLGISGATQISVAGRATVQGFSVPNPTAEEMVAIYNAVVAGNSVQVVDNTNVYYQVMLADSMDGAINVEIMFFSELAILYSLEHDVVTIEAKKIGGGAGGLPDQTGNEGKFLTTDGANASWSDKPLVNTAKDTNVSTVSIKGEDKSNLSGNVLIGDKATQYNSASVNMVAIGNFAQAYSRGASVGSFAEANGEYSIAIGANSRASGKGAIQLGKGTNSNANTFKVANANGNFELMSADGTIPAERITKTATLTTDSVQLVSDTIYSAGELASVTLTLPETLDPRFISEIHFTSGATATTFAFPTGNRFDGEDCDNGVFIPVANKRYSIMFFYDGMRVCGLVYGY